MPFDFFLIPRLVVVFACFLMTAIGCSQWQFGNDAGYRYYFSGLQLGSSSVRPIDDLGCSSFTNTMNTGYAFSIMASIFLAFTLISIVFVLMSCMITSMQEYGGPLRTVSLICAVISFVCLTIAWPVTESARSRRHCGAAYSLSARGFGIARGLALLIASWVLMLFDVIISVVSLVRGSRSLKE